MNKVDTSLRNHALDNKVAVNKQQHAWKTSVLRSKCMSNALSISNTH